MTRQTRRRVLLEGLGVVILLVPLHFFLHRPDRTAWGTAAALLLFFLPAMLAVARVEAGTGGVAAEALGYLVFGFGLGLLVGGLGAIGRALLHVATGDPLPVRLALWIAIASSWILATAAAYGLILFLVWALRNGVAPADSRARTSPVAGRPAPPVAGPLRGSRPGLGDLEIDRVLPGSRLPPTAAMCGLAGLGLGMAGLIVHLEGWAHGLTLLALAAVLLVAMLALRGAAARRARSSR
jgi:hypothetical protein